MQDSVCRDKIMQASFLFQINFRYPFDQNSYRNISRILEKLLSFAMRKDQSTV